MIISAKTLFPSKVTGTGSEGLGPGHIFLEGTVQQVTPLSSLIHVSRALTAEWALAKEKRWEDFLGREG